MPFTRTPLGENLFNLDPINTNLTAPVSNISVQQPQQARLPELRSHRNVALRLLPRNPAG